MSQYHYSRFSHEERIILENRLANGEKPIRIAEALKRPRCTIYREIARNSKPSVNHTTRVNQPILTLVDARNYRGSELAYEVKKAKQNYQKRVKQFQSHDAKYTAKYAEQMVASRYHKQTRLLDRPGYKVVLGYMLDKLNQRWSPEQISGRIKVEGILPSISHTTIYSYIYHIEDSTTRKSLISCLRRKGKPYRHEKHITYNQTNRAKHSIHDKPNIVNELVRLGDLEGDTIVGSSGQDRIITHVCRVTGLLSMGRVLNFNANTIASQTVQDVARVFGDTIQTITYDNGCEFSAWRQTEIDTGSTIYFADPYTPSQRGTNENTNGLIRDYLPKGTDFKKLTDRDILYIEDSLNNRPRKRLGYLTPLEMYDLVR